ncbi:hypothetical protein QBC34DRAFT_452984 [Podospora aff. communis PSN243]|uniref:Uncharacterized protein n=1 Tax=Podospora aff. communis PSN243 TaxID=3040156 RepID=A0AAV9G4B5_9PEZI|nr:hypothetical protein QBC34DRAFT_452984 [Podospora aff. communis PSN243]
MTAYSGSNAMARDPSASSDADKPYDTAKAPKTGSDSFSWTLELLSLLLSIAALGSAVGLLVHFDQKPVADWNASVSLNAIVSALGNVSRATLAFAISGCIAQGKWNWFAGRSDSLIAFDRFDDATKGPWGSLRLLPTVARRRHWITLGVLVTVILVGFEPFLQAALNLEDRTFVFPGDASGSAGNLNEATTSRCTRLDAGTFRERLGNTGSFAIPFKTADGQNSSIFGLPYKLQPDPGMIAAVWLGFSPQATVRDLSPLFSCTSGNCSWDPFPTLAVCSKCHDHTSRLVRSSGITQVKNFDGKGWEENSTMPSVTNTGFDATFFDGKSLVLTDESRAYTQYIFPGLAPLNLSNYNGPPRCPGRSACPDTYLAAKIETNPGHTLGFRDSETLIMAFQYIVADSSWSANRTTWEETPVSAGECALYYCINAYASKVESGELIETVVGSWANKSPNSYVRRNTTSREYEIASNETLDYTYFGIERTDLQLYIPPGADKLPNISFDAGAAKFNISQSTIFNTMVYLTQEIGGREQVHDYFNVSFPYPSLGGWLDTPELVTAVAKAADSSTGGGGVHRAFEHAAQGFTKWMRDRAFREDVQREASTSEQQEILTGTVSRVTVVFSAQWLFLLWPGVSVLLALVFVAMSVWDTRAKGLPPWKSSSLVTLAFGLDQADKTELREALMRRDASRVARRTNARLRKGGSQPGLELSRSTGSEVLP